MIEDRFEKIIKMINSNKVNINNLNSNDKKDLLKYCYDRSIEIENDSQLIYSQNDMDEEIKLRIEDEIEERCAECDLKCSEKC